MICFSCFSERNRFNLQKTCRATQDGMETENVGELEMIHAFVMLNVEAGKEEDVLEKLRAFDIVEEAYVSYGVYDLVVKVKAETMGDLSEVVTHKIRDTEYVQSTLTLPMTGE